MLNTPATHDMRTLNSTTPATLTLNQSGNSTFTGALVGHVSLVKNNGGTITFAGMLSTTTGDITLDKGSIVVESGAGFSASGSVNVNDGVLDLRSAVALPAEGNLKVADSGKVRVSSGLSVPVGYLFVDGVAQPRGTYGATGSGATYIDDNFFEGSGVVDVNYNPAIVPTTYVWDNGGADNEIATAENWDGDVVPPSDGTASLVFATGGSEANLSTPMDVYGLTFNAGNNFTITGSGVALSNGRGGISAVAPDAGARNYYVGSDIVLSDHQTWLVDSSSGTTTLEVMGSISDNALVPCNLVKSGSGGLVLSSANSFNGDLTVEEGSLHISHGEALGSTNGMTHIKGINNGKLYLYGGLEVGEPLLLEGEYKDGGTLFSNTGSNTLSGPISIKSQVRLKINASAPLVISGGVVEEQSNRVLFVMNAAGPLYFNTKPLLIDNKVFYTDSGGVTTLNVAGNRWAEGLVANGTLRCGQPYVMPPNASLRIGINYGPRGTFDLNGFDQEIGDLFESSTNVMTCVITSAEPATLKVNQSTDRVIGYRLTGAVSLHKSGEKTLTMTNICSATGSVTIDEGVLKLNGVGSFGDGCTAVNLVESGVLSLANNSALAPTTIVNMPAADSEESSAKVEIEGGVEVVVGELYYGTKMKRAGTWGSSASPAVYKDDNRFSGTGVLRVLHDDAGTLIILR